jgi:multiple sugar transport system substrate-binding protein
MDTRICRLYRSKTRTRFSIFTAGILFLFLAGCPKSSQDADKGPIQRPFAGVKLKLQVVDDPEMAKAIERLRGEWNAQSGSEFEVIQAEEKDLAQIDNLPADAVICSSRLFADLAEKKLLAEVPERIQSGSNWRDVFELPKIREASWGGKIYGLSFGSPVLTIYYRADLLKKLHRAPPKTWGEYQDVARLLAAEKPSTPESPWFGTLEPLAPGWAGVMLLARAAPLAKHRNNYSTWFNADTMEPLITTPPVVQALARMVEAAKTNAAESLKCDPAAVRRAFGEGKCGMAITWPTAGQPKDSTNSAAANEESKHDSDDKSADKKAVFDVDFIELPYSRQVFNVNNHTWEVRQEEDSPYVPFLGIAGRIGAAGANSSAREAAFALLDWLSDGQNSVHICPVSDATTLFRKSQLAKPQIWIEKELAPSVAPQYAKIVSTTLNRESWVDFRLPGRAEYLAALDEAVQAAVQGTSPPEEALSKAAEKWRQITDKLGKDRQKAAYLHSLGLD